MTFIGLNQCRKCGKALDRNHPTSWCDECINKEAERRKKDFSRNYELKPCPFCGSKPKLDCELSSDTWYVWCTQCFAETVGSLDKDVAIGNWNMRVGDFE